MSFQAQTQLLAAFSEKNSTGDSRFGNSVAGIGDVNNDSCPDFAAVAENIYPYGRVYIYFGGPAADTIPDVIIDGTSYTAGCRIVSGIGDINNDSFDDIAVGNFQYNSQQGAVQVFLGGNPMSTTAAFSMFGEASGNNFGFSVSSGADFNGDGFSDFAVGAYGYGGTVGRVFGYLGGAAPDSIPDIVITGEPGFLQFGYAVSSAGDVNNDAFDELLVTTAPIYGYYGRGYVFYGGVIFNTIPGVILQRSWDEGFGVSAASAGDVNGDFYEDIIIGAYAFNGNQGRAYLYYGGPMWMDTTADVIMTGEVGTSQFGQCVSGGGDVNNDGYDDVIVGAPYYNGGQGRTYIFLGGAPMDNAADIVLTGEPGGGRFGFSIAEADFNSDGYTDVVAGACEFAGLGGRLYIFKGANTMDNSADYVVSGEGTWNYFGRPVAELGDINADGIPEIAIGATGYDDGRGRVYIYSGGLLPDNMPDFILTGQNPREKFGCSVSSAGDVNHDGYNDIIVGAYMYSSYTGRVYIYLGGPLFDITPDIVLSGETTNSFFGSTVSCAGDVNGDQYSDVIVGAYYHSSQRGSVYLYLGGSPMNNIVDLRFSGESPGSYYGTAINTAGDVNNDGYSDIIIGAPWMLSQKGKVYLYFGGAVMDTMLDVAYVGEFSGNRFGYTLSPAGNVNGDLYADFLVGAPYYNNSTGRVYLFAGAASPSSSPALICTGATASDMFGLSISGKCDLNDDGSPDFLAGAPNAESGKGAVYCFYGGALLNNASDFSVTGSNSFSRLGNAVSPAGDINGDGWDDFIAGASEWPQNGKAFLYTHQDAPLPVELSAFEAEQAGTKIHLRWRTETEHNNAGFIIQRSCDEYELAGIWTDVGYREGAGNSNSPIEYQFTDENPPGTGTVLYRLKQTDADGSVSYSKICAVTISYPVFFLEQNFPNPFNAETVIRYTIAEKSFVTLKVFDLLGNEVCTLCSKEQAPGSFKIRFNGAAYPSGMYYYCLAANNYFEVRKLLLLK